MEPNLLVIRVNPMEGIYIKINAKKPGSDSEIQPLAMDFCQSCMIGINSPEAYERLLHDAAEGILRTLPAGMKWRQPGLS